MVLIVVASLGAGRGGVGRVRGELGHDDGEGAVDGVEELEEPFRCGLIPDSVALTRPAPPPGIPRQQTSRAKKLGSEICEGRT